MVPKGLTVTGKPSSRNRAPMLSAKHEPTKSISSHGPILNPGSGITTIVLNTILFYYLHRMNTDFSRIILFIRVYPLPLTSADLKSGRGERHIHETGIPIYSILMEYLLDPCSCLGILGNHIQVAATTGTRQFVA